VNFDNVESGQLALFLYLMALLTSPESGKVIRLPLLSIRLTVTLH